MDNLQKFARWLTNHSAMLFLIFLFAVGVFFIWFAVTGFSQDTTLVSIGVAAISAFFAAVSAFASWVQAAEAQRQTAMQERPYIIGYFEGAYGGFVYYVLENAGNSPAVDVNINFDPAPVNHVGQSMNEISLYREPISFFPPEKKYRQLIDNSEKFLTGDNSVRFDAKLAYKTVHGEVIEDTITYDLAYLHETHLPLRTLEESLHKLTKKSEELLHFLNKVEKGGSLMVEFSEGHWRRVNEAKDQRKS